MVNKDIVTEMMLFNHFEGKTEPLQNKVIELWLEDPQNQDFYYQCLEQWLNKNNIFKPNEKQAYQNIVNREVAIIKPKDKSFVLRLFSQRWAVATTILFISCVSLFFAREVILFRSVSTAFGETKKIILPDSSVVTLNANTTIQYPRFGFGMFERIVKLNGEADFNVVHKIDNLPFLVKTFNNLEVKVLGTKFNVYARNAKADVVLKEGKVLLKHYEHQIVKNDVLIPGDLYTSNTNSGISKITHIQHPENITAWKNREFVFEEQKFSDIAQIFKDDFGIDVFFENSALANTVISGTVHANSSEDLIEVIAFLLEINYKIDKNRVYFFE